MARRRRRTTDDELSMAKEILEAMATRPDEPEEEPAESPETTPEPVRVIVPPPPPAPTPRRTEVSFAVWKRLSGIKFTHLAGFAWYVKSQGWKRGTVPEWRERYETFLKKPC